MNCDQIYEGSPLHMQLDTSLAKQIEECRRATERREKLIKQQQLCAMRLHDAQLQAQDEPVMSPIPVDAVTKINYTALYQAARKGETEIVDAFLASGANTNYTIDGYSPLGTACWSGHAETVECFIQHGVDVNYVDITTPDHIIYSPLALACRNGYAAIVKLLIDADVLISVRDAEGRTCLMVAVFFEFLEVVKLILDTPGGAALVNIACNEGRTPVMSANTHPMLKVLLEKGASVTCVDVHGDTVLHWCILRVSPPAVICTLIAAGADVLAVNHKGETAVCAHAADLPCCMNAHNTVYIYADFAMDMGALQEEALFRRLETLAKRRAADAVNTPSLESLTQDDAIVLAVRDDNVREKKLKKKVRPCAHCGEVTHRRCSGCVVTFYCSRICQKACYAAHKIECPQVRDAAVAVDD